MTEENTEVSSTDNSEHASSGLVICFVFTGLLVGALLREINKKFKIPYTPMLLAVGILGGSQISQLGVLGNAITTTLQIDPEGILMIFIPTLIFESGYNADWYIFKRAIINILILAGPGVLVTAVLLGLIFKVILFYPDSDLTWPAAFMLGSIIAATDPVAVVALLKELGAPNKFNLLIEGESLLNDGTAMVFFAVFLNMVKGVTAGAGAVFINFAQLAIGGPIFGFLVGIVASIWLARITRDGVLSISLTFIACYLMFYVAETYLHVSGLLALVTLGLFMSATGKTKIDHESGHFVHAVWAWLQYSCETLIFLLAGALIGYHIIFNASTTIVASDWIKMLIFYVFMIGARAAMVALFLPIIRRHGYGLTKEEFVVLVWGGLRGALGLALALIVSVDDSLDARMRDLVLFYMAGMATLTLIVNGATCGWIVKRLNMVIEPPIKERLQQNLLTEMVISSNQRIEQLKLNRFLKVCDWKAVEKIVGLEDLHSAATKGSVVESHELRNLVEKNRSDSVYKSFADDDVYQEARFRMLRMMKGIYWEMYEETQIRGESVRLLVESVNNNMDKIHEPVNLWTFLYVYFTSFKSIKFIIKVKDFFLIGRLAKKYIANHLAFIYEVVAAFIEACEEIISTARNIPISQTHIDIVIEEFEKNKMDATNYIISLEETFADLIKAIQIQKASNGVLEFQKHFINDMLNSGQIEEKEYKTLRREIDRRIIKLDSMKVDWTAPTFNNFVVEFPFFACLRKDEITQLVKRAEPKKFHKGDSLLEKGQPVSALYIMTRGVVQETFDGKKQHSKGIGSMLNVANILNSRNLAISDVICFSEVQCQAIPMQVLEIVIHKNEEFKVKIYKQALLSFLFERQDEYKNYIKYDETKINEASRNSAVITYTEGNKFTLENGGYVFNGELRKSLNPDGIEKQITYDSFSLVPPSGYEYVTIKQSIVLEFDEDGKDIFFTRDSRIDGRRKSSKVNFRQISTSEYKPNITPEKGEMNDLEKNYQAEYNKNLTSKGTDYLLK